MKLRVLIVDDEALARSRMRTLLADCANMNVELVGEAERATQAMELMRHGDIDLLLLDIHMPGADGLSLARVVQDMPNPPLVVFVTAHAEHAVNAFELEALDYLTKPVRLERLRASLQKAVQQLAARTALQGAKDDGLQAAITIHERGKIFRVPLDEVLFFKAELKYITVRTAGGSYLLDGSLNDLEQRFGHAFLRVHRNAMVARRAMRALVRQADDGDGEWAVSLQGIDELIQVSRRQAPTVREALGGGHTGFGS